MPKFIVYGSDDSPRLAGFDSREDLIDNLRYEIAQLFGNAALLKELKRLRGDADWECTPEPNKEFIDKHQELISWVLVAQPGDLFVEERDRRVFCLNDSVGNVRYL